MGLQRGWEQGGARVRARIRAQREEFTASTGSAGPFDTISRSPGATLCSGSIRLTCRGKQRPRPCHGLRVPRPRTSLPESLPLKGGRATREIDGCLIAASI